MAYLGLCYQPKGILFWKLDTVYDNIKHHIGNTSIIDLDGNPVPGMYEAIRDDINPYIKTIDEYYMPLTWETSYPVDLGSGFPYGSSDFIEDITAVTNPDSIRNEAPAVTATVWFNREKVRSDFVRIIDIAKTVKRDDNNNWIGIPDTVKTGIAQNGAITYVTTLRAGEERLYKIIPVIN